MIPDVEKHLDYMLTHSDPGDAIHHALIIDGKPAVRGPLGALHADDQSTDMYAIIADDSCPAEEMIQKILITAAGKAKDAGRQLHFVALTVEAYTVDLDPHGDEVKENRARRMQADRQLKTHPEAVEATLLLAACRDGRRWNGRRILTGPNAGRVSGPNLHDGPLLDISERNTMQRLIRNVVGCRIPGGGR